MSRVYTSEQFWKLYDNLPQELKDALFNEETGHNIYEACKRNEVLDHLEGTIEYVGRVLVGVLSPEDFQMALEKDIGLEQGIARKVSQEINRFIFYPVKPCLEELYKMGSGPSAQPIKIIAPPGGVNPEIKPEKTSEKDTYRETVE